MFEKAREALVKNAQTPFEKPYKPTYKDAVKSLSKEIWENLKAGYSFEAIVSIINDAEGLEMSAATAREYLRELAPKKRNKAAHTRREKPAPKEQPEKQPKEQPKPQAAPAPKGQPKEKPELQAEATKPKTEEESSASDMLETIMTGGTLPPVEQTGTSFKIRADKRKVEVV